MSISSLIRFLIITAILSSNLCNAEPLLHRTAVGHTENAVVMPDGRYFVAGYKGIFEVKRAPDFSPNCDYDAFSDLTYCLQVTTDYDPEYGPGRCFFSGMTTDGHYLYAACTAWHPYVPILYPKAAIYRVLPGASEAQETLVRHLDNPIWYNGMTMLNDDTLLMSASQNGSMLGYAGPAIEKLSITDHASFEFELSDWLDTGGSMLLPNGIVNDETNVYFITGQRLLKIALDDSGNPGDMETIYSTPFFKIMDDLTLSNGTLAVCEHAAINGLGKNYITLIDTDTPKSIERISTGKIQLSSLAVDKGNLIKEGELIGTSFFQGGIHHFSREDTIE